MEREGEKGYLFVHRDFLKAFWIWRGALTLDSLTGLSLSFAKDGYPLEKIAYMTAAKAGGDYDIIVHGIGPYLTKCLREISTCNKGGELIVKNEPRGIQA